MGKENKSFFLKILGKQLSLVLTCTVFDVCVFFFFVLFIVDMAWPYKFDGKVVFFFFFSFLFFLFFFCFLFLALSCFLSLSRSLVS